jgi:protein-L-isoaspartate(D-aspartate) O-methyltransferase
MPSVISRERRRWLGRRQFIMGATSAGVVGLVPRGAAANVPMPYNRNAYPPTAGRAEFIDWMVKNRGEEPLFLGRRFDRFQQLLAHKDLWDKSDMRAFLMVPREEFVTAPNRDVAYEWHHLDIGFGVTVTGPHTVGRMTNSLAIAPGEKVLEVGTGSGYQSAVLANLTDKVWSIEIIPALAARTRHLYNTLIGRGYTEYRSIVTRNADGYYGWEENAPYNKMIVTCGIDHIPPPLLRQLKAGGVMVIPVGPPGAQHVIKVVKRENSDGTITVVRSDIYGGAIIPFVPFTKLSGDLIKGTHNGE